jgi:hypothetical protein
MDTEGHTWVLHSFDFTHGGRPGQPFLASSGLLVGNASIGGTGFAPKGLTYGLKPQAPVAALTLGADTLPPGGSTTAVITLARPAPTGGQAVAIMGTNGLNLPGQVVVAAGATSASFTVRVAGGDGGYQATVTASIGPLGATAPLTVPG